MPRLLKRVGVIGLGSPVRVPLPRSPRRCAWRGGTFRRDWRGRAATAGASCVGALHVLDGVREIARLMRDDAEQMKRFGIARLGVEHAARKHLGLGRACRPGGAARPAPELAAAKAWAPAAATSTRLSSAAMVPAACRARFSPAARRATARLIACAALASSLRDARRDLAPGLTFDLAEQPHASDTRGCPRVRAASASPTPTA